MKKRNIIVIGASAGGFEAFKTIISALPPHFDASIFIVWHLSPTVRSILPQVLNQCNRIYAATALDGETIMPNRIYVAPPDHHMLVEDGVVRVTNGPKENKFRPAVDPLFRSAAYHYKNNVVGVILSGALDDGTSGLWAVKHYGGVAVVQDPADAEVASMPENAMRHVNVDFSVPLKEIAPLLVRLCAEEIEVKTNNMNRDERTEIEIRIAENGNAFQSGIMQYGQLTPFACPECHGVLSKMQEGSLIRYRCHTGHAYTADVLLHALTEKIEDSLYSALRGIEESILLLNQLGDHFAEGNHPKLAALYFQKAKEAEARTELVRKAIQSHEQLSKDALWQQVKENEACETRNNSLANKENIASTNHTN